MAKMNYDRVRMERAVQRSGSEYARREKEEYYMTGGAQLPIIVRDVAEPTRLLNVDKQCLIENTVIFCSHCATKLADRPGRLEQHLLRCNDQNAVSAKARSKGAIDSQKLAHPSSFVESKNSQSNGGQSQARLKLKGRKTFDVTVTVPGGNELRPRIPKILFEGFSRVVLQYAGHTTAVDEHGDGRSRMPIAVVRTLEAKPGDVLGIICVSPGYFEVEVALCVEKPIQTLAPILKEKTAGTSTQQTKTKVIPPTEYENVNYPVGDPRRHMTRNQRKKFNRSPEGKALFASGYIRVPTRPESSNSTSLTPQLIHRTRPRR